MSNPHFEWINEYRIIFQGQNSHFSGFSGSKFTRESRKTPTNPPSSAGPSHAHGTALSAGRAVGTVGLKVGWSEKKKATPTSNENASFQIYHNFGILRYRYITFPDQHGNFGIYHIFRYTDVAKQWIHNPWHNSPGEVIRSQQYMDRFTSKLSHVEWGSHLKRKLCFFLTPSSADVLMFTEAQTALLKLLSFFLNKSLLLAILLA